jgi:hypothetical protein
MTQQSCPWVQQLLPQQVSALAHVMPLSQGGAEHTPWLHVGVLPTHLVPQAPQLKGSSCLSTHLSSQQV